MIEKVENYIEQELQIPVWAVGGAVRDELLGREYNDLDFATNLDPDEVEKRIRAAGRKAYCIGKRFGTIGVTVDGEKIEITTFRTEKYQPGCRKPQVEFLNDYPTVQTGLQADLARRDFTINSIAKKGGKYIDYFGGRIDLLDRVIKTVGKPRDRFKEDPLRMLRAARFAAQFGFDIDQTVENTMKKMAPAILDISKERWVDEMDKLLVSDSVGLGLWKMMQTRLFNCMIPELSLQDGYDQDSPYHDLDLWEHTYRVVENSPNDVEVRWAALLHDIGKPFVRTPRNAGGSNYIDHEKVGAEIAGKVAIYLRWSNKRRENVCELILTHMKENSPLREADNSAKKARV